ncbi:nucleotidyltransferase family protein [Aggregatilineales bacterium SYSU G02658]
MTALSYADRLRVNDEQIAAFCQRWRIVELALFGSVLREDFHPQSDVDVLVTFAEDAVPSLLRFVEMTQELEALLGRRVDVVTRRSIVNSANHIRRSAILSSAQVIYAAG